MKQKIKSLLAILVVLCMLFAVTACNDASTTSSEIPADDDFFGTTISGNEQTGSDVTSTDSGVQSGEQTGTESNTQTGTQSNAQTGTQSNAQTGTQSNAQTGTQSNAQTGTQSSNKDTQSNAQTGTQSNAQTGTQSSNKDTQSNAQTGTQSNAQTGTQSSNKPGFQINTQTNTQSGSQSGSQSGTQSNVQSNTQSNVQSNTQSGTINTVVPEENTIGGKSWQQVLASMPKNLRGTKLVMYNWNPATEYTGAPAVMDAFTRQTGIKVEWRKIDYTQYFTKLPALIASGENIPDMVRARGPIPSRMLDYQDLSVAKYDFTDEAWDQSIMDLYSVGDKVYATSLKNTHIGCVSLLFYNKSLIDKYDFEDPYTLWKAGEWDWDKYIEMCKEYKNLTDQPGSNGEGHFPLYLATYGFEGAIGFNGKQFYSNFHDKKFLEVHQLLGKLYNEDSLFAFGGEKHFNEGNVLFSIGSAVHMRNKNSYFGNLKAAKTLYAVPMPEIPGQDKYYQGYGEAEAYAIPKGAPNPEAVPYFLRYFLDGANYELSTYFGNTQNLEVYNWCMDQKNKVFSYSYPDDVAAVAEGGIQVQASSQMKSYIDSNVGKVNQMVKEYNADLEKLK